MNTSNRLNEDAKEYLNNFYSILDNMMNSMTRAEPTDSISADFMPEMLTHRLGAIQISKNALRFPTKEYRPR